MFIQFIAILFTVFFSVTANAQIDNGLTYSVESGVTVVSGKYFPLLLNANKHGLSSIG